MYTTISGLDGPQGISLEQLIIIPSLTEWIVDLKHGLKVHWDTIEV